MVIFAISGLTAGTARADGGPINPPWPADLLTPCEGENVQAVTPGTWMPENHAAVIREFTWNFGGDAPEVWVYFTNGMPNRLYAGSGFNNGDPLSERAIWHRCDGAPWPNMAQDAYDEATRLLAGSLGFRPKNVFVNGVPFTGTVPGGGSANPGTVRPVVAVPVGTTIPAGRAVIVRAVGSDNAVFIYVERSLKTPLYVASDFGFAVWTSVDGQPWASMAIDGCGEAVEVIRGGLGPTFRWTTVFLDGVRMPTPTCPDP